MNQIIYFQKSDKYPVLDFIKKQPLKVQAKILKDIGLLEEFGSTIGMPYVRKISGYEEIWELRTKLTGNEYRIFYFTKLENEIVLLHGIQKKDQKTPLKELRITEKRRKKYLQKEDCNES